jgi:NADH-quinone oxidoreductase subunit L
VDGILDGTACGLLLLPLLSALLNGLWLGRRHPKAAAWTATALMGMTAVLSLVLAGGYLADVFAASDFPDRAAIAWDPVWMSFGGEGEAGPGLAVRFGFYLDPISVMMCVVVAVISFLVNLYSVGYMAGDRGAGRFFPILAFFSFAMLGLVSSSNLLQTFFFWELVGVASYLLIGFWYTRPAAVAASKKAFIMTRLADAFFLMGVLLAGIFSGGFDFPHLNSAAAAAALDRPLALGLFTANLLTLATMLLYAGAWGKSAMFPLHGWLPDAMEGPTPVSSLIHSATMVVAGVYLTARLFPLFAAADGTLVLVEWTGAFTALFAAVIACAQTDLKRILAFSTLSQLGLMMAALGAGAGTGAVNADGATAASLAYPASMFHVFTHAFFKCLLFLSAGVVIHAIHSNDIRDAGGLRKALPLTYAATLVAVLAIAGIPPFSGFFSKEEILMAAWLGGHPVAFFSALATGGLTAFYMTRYFLLTFHGPRGGHAAGHVEEARPRENLVMLLPILILALPSAAIGYLARKIFPIVVQIPHLPPAYRGVKAEHGPAWLPIAATALAVLGVGLGWLFYGRGGRAGRTVGYPEGKAPAWYRIIRERFYVDDLYLWLARKAAGQGLAAPANWFERVVINGSFDALSWFLRRCAGLVVRLQNGQVQLYMGLAVLGLCLLYLSARGFAG